MKKLLCICFVSLLVLTGCGKEETSKSEEPKQDVQQQTSSVEINDNFSFDGYKETNAEDLKFSSISETETRVFAYKGTEEIVVIPEVYNGKKIVESKRTFWNDTKVKAVKFPSTVEKVEEDFAVNKNIEYVEFSEGLKEIGESEFLNCSNLKAVKLPSTLEQIHNSVFSNCESLKSLEIPDSITYIAEYTFLGCDEDFTLIGEAGGYVEQYAKEMGIKFKAK